MGQEEKSRIIRWVQDGIISREEASKMIVENSYANGLFNPAVEAANRIVQERNNLQFRCGELHEHNLELEKRARGQAETIDVQRQLIEELRNNISGLMDKVAMLEAHEKTLEAKIEIKDQKLKELEEFERRMYKEAHTDTWYEPVDGHMSMSATRMAPHAKRGPTIVCDSGYDD